MAIRIPELFIKYGKNMKEWTYEWIFLIVGIFIFLNIFTFISLGIEEFFIRLKKIREDVNLFKKVFGYGYFYEKIFGIKNHDNKKEFNYDLNKKYSNNYKLKNYDKIINSLELQRKKYENDIYLNK